MILDLPKIGLTRFDDNLSEAEFKAELERLSKKYEFDIPRSELTYGEVGKRAIGRGIKELGSTFGDIIPAMGAAYVGADDYARQQMEEAAATQRQIQEEYAPQFPSMKDVRGIGDVPKFAFETIVEQIPNIVTSLIPGVGVEAIAARTTASAIGKDLAAQAIKKGLVGDAATAFVEAGIQKAAPEIAKKSAFGQNLGIYLGSYAQNAPEVFQNIYQETGQLEPGAAMLFGAASAALDSVLPSQLMKSLTGPVKVGVVEKLLEGSGMKPGLARSIGANVLKNMGYEGLTEGAQEAISIAAENFVASKPQVFQSKDWDRIIESAVKGSVAGGGFGVAGGVAERTRQVQERQKRYDEVMARRTSTLQERQEAKDALEAAKQAEIDAHRQELSQAAMGSEEEQTELAKLQQRLPLTDKERKAVEALNKQREKQQAAELKAAQQKLKQFLKAKQGELDLQEAPPTAGTAVEGQGDLFAPQVRPAATPQEVSTKVTDATLKDLGIGHTALIRKNKLLEGKDLSNPTDAAEVKRILEAYLEKGPSQGIAQKVEAFLNRPEFKATEVLREQPTTESIARAGEPSVSDIGRVAEERVSGSPAGIAAPIKQGLGRVTEATRPAPSGERVEQAPLGKREIANVAKAEAAVAPAVKEQLDFISENDRRANDLLNAQVRDEVAAEAAKQSGLKGEQSDYAARLNELIPSEDHIGSEAHNALRLPGLFNEFFRLQEVTQKAQEPKQRAKNVKEMEAIKEAIHKSGPDADAMLSYLGRMTPQQREAALSNVNRHARDVFTETARQRVAEAKERLDKQANKEQGTKSVTENEGIKAQEDFDEDLETVLAAFNESKLSKTVEEAIPKGFNAFVASLANAETDPDIKHILNKVNKLGLKTKVVVGKVKGKGKLNQYNLGEYDPDTDTITLDPERGLNNHTAVHELIHAAISHVLRSPNNPLTKEFTQFFEQIQNRLGAAYGAQDIQEFASELVSNPQFQALLKSIKAPKSGSLFSRIMQTIAEFFGFRKGSSAFQKGLDLVSKAVDISGDVEALPGDKLFLGMGDFNIVSEIGKQMPTLAGRAIESTKNNLSNIQAGGWMRTASGLLRLDNINTLYGKQLPSVKTLLNALEMRTGKQEARIKQINDTYNRMHETQKKFPQQVTKLNDIAYEASANELDLADPKFKPEPKDKALYDKLKNQYNALPQPVQQIYKDARSFYDRSMDEYMQFLLANTPASLHARITAEFQASKRLKGYIPFLRRGEYWVEFADPATGERAASAFESIRERQQFIDSVLAPQKIDFTTKQHIQDITFIPSQVPPTTFVGEIIRELRGKGASDEMINQVYQSYLTLFPAQSITKQFMKRKNVAGMEKDIIRAYGDVGIKWSRKLTNSEYGPKIDQAVDQIVAEAENANRPELSAIAQNIVNQRGFYHNPTFGKLTHAATTLSYFEYIAGNISSALVNLTSLPMLVWPTLGAKFGFDRASAVMAAASKVAMNGMEKDPRYKALYQTLMDHAQLQHTMAREVLEGRRQTTSEFSGLKAKVFDALSIPFAATERYNRATTAIAAFELAKGRGMNEQQAIEYALTTVKDLHTSGLASTAPSWMQNPIGRVFFTFKSYTWNSAFVLARAFHQAFKGESPEVRAMARRQLLGIYGMSMAFAGVKGLPFFGAVSTLAKMIQALFGDDDEPYDLEDELRQTIGELAYKGPVNYFTNLEIANRSGLAQDLLFRDDPRGVAEHGYVLSAMQQAFGPAGTYAVNVGNAFKMMGEGHTERAIEAMMPSFLRNGMKGARYMTEGALTLKGDPIKEDVSAYNSFMQVLGFSPADISANYERSSAGKAYEKDVSARRQKLLNLHDMAKTSGDMELLADTKAQISAFNSKHPKDKIDSTTLAKSEAARKAAEKQMIDGVKYNKKLRGEIKEKFLED